MANPLGNFTLDFRQPLDRVLILLFVLDQMTGAAADENSSMGDRAKAHAIAVKCRNILEGTRI